jgi:hypothetical protein
MVTLRSNEEWRNDPLRRNKARALCAEKARLYAKLIEQLEEADKTLRSLRNVGEQKPTQWNNYRMLSFAYERERLQATLEHYANPTETLIGNIAAFKEMDEYV